MAGVQVEQWLGCWLWGSHSDPHDVPLPQEARRHSWRCGGRARMWFKCGCWYRGPTWCHR